jgi:hypothetical protein
MPSVTPSCRFTRLTPKAGKIRLARGALNATQDKDQITPLSVMAINYTHSGWQPSLDNAPESRPERSILVTDAPLLVGDVVDLKCADDFRSDLLRTSLPDHSGIERLANEYGFSNARLESYILSDGSQAFGEPVDSWIELILMHRIVAAMITARAQDDPEILRRELDEASTWEKDSRSEPPSRNSWSAAYEELTWAHLLDSARSMLQELEGNIVWDDVAELASSPIEAPPLGRIPNRPPVEVLINMALSSTQLAVDRWAAKSSLEISIIGARPASWASLVYSLASGRAPSTCEQCGRLMSPHAASKPGYRRFCGDSCRVRQSRIKKRAKALKAKGKSRPRIAKELGLDLELVRKWFP